MPEYKYANLNAFPIYLPDERGGQVLFREGESTTRNWFSRFLGHRALTRVKLKEQKPQEPVSIPEEEMPDMTRGALPPKKATFPDTETDQYKLSKGIYRCKLCEEFLTGSSSSMATHIVDFHGLRPEDLKVPTVNPSVSSRPDVGSPPAADAVKGDGEDLTDPSGVVHKFDEDDGDDKPKTPAGDVSTAPSDPDTPPKKPQESEAHACPHPGCGKEFSTQRGLTMHIRRAHNDASS